MYKRQPQGILLVMEQRSCEICEMLDLDAQGRKPLLMVLDNLQDPGNLGTIPVSYTHLDVYKRQPPYRIH